MSTATRFCCLCIFFQVACGDSSTGSEGTNGSSSGDETTAGQTTAGQTTAGQTTGQTTVDATTVGETTIGETTTDASSSDSTSGSSETSMGSESATDTQETTGTGNEPPALPPGLERYLVGEEGDADVEPQGPGLILMGGSTDVDAAFAWWKPLVNGGDVVILRTSGSDGYNDYLYSEIGGVDSVETLLVTSVELANSEYVGWAISHAEGVFMAGGDQAQYMNFWKDTGVEDALHDAWERGAVIGGTSAGLAVLGEYVYAAYNDTVYGYEALEDPYNMYMTLDRDFLDLPMLGQVITDSHFSERERLGRLIGFIARIIQDGWGDPVIGIGIDERTAVVVGPGGEGEVLGEGAVYVLHSNGMPQACEPGVPLTYENLQLHQLVAGDTLSFPGALTEVPAMPQSAIDGVLVPNPYP